jgi:hypothetical protein
MKAIRIVPILCVLCGLCGCSSEPPPAPQTLASRAGFTAEHLASGIYRVVTFPIQDVRFCIVTPGGITLLEIDNRAPLVSGTFALAATPH